MTATRRHQILIEWEDHAQALEEAFGEPIIMDHLERMAETPGTFDSVFGNIEKLFSAAPWLVEDAGYGWATDRSAYRFAAEALNQWRLLNAIVSMTDPDDPEQRRAVAGIIARQPIAWRIEHAEPTCDSIGAARYVMLPFGWDNAIALLLLVLRSHPRLRSLFARITPAPAPIDDWTAPAKGLLLLSMPLLDDGSLLVDSFAIHEMSQAHPWWEDAVYTLADIDDPVVRTLASIGTDWVIGQEVGHALFHGSVEASLERELEADRASLLALMTWSRPRDLSGLRPDLSANFWDYLSARLMLFVLAMIGETSGASAGSDDGAAVDGVGARATGLQRLIHQIVEQTSVTTEELILIDDLETGFDVVKAELDALTAATPPWAAAHARRAAIEADATMRAELAAHKAKGGGPIMPEPADE